MIVQLRAAKPADNGGFHGIAPNNSEHESGNDVCAPQTVSVHIGRGFEGTGDAGTLSRMYDRSTLFHLLCHVVLALVSLALSALATLLVLLAPPDRTALVPWIAAPAAIMALGLGGFALVRLSASPTSITFTGEPEE